MCKNRLCSILKDLIVILTVVLLLSLLIRQISSNGQPDTRFEENKSLFGEIVREGQAVLYEGLPHQNMQKSQFDDERKKKKTIQLYGYSSYEIPLEVSEEDKVKIKATLKDSSSFRQWRGEKKCGGFHPDYLAEYHNGEATYQFLICLGCHEVILCGPNRSLRCDIHEKSYEELKALLKKYVKNRPTQRES